MTMDSKSQALIVELEFPVRTYDIDFVGIVNNIVYIRWLEDLRLKILEEHLPLDHLLADGKAPVLAATEIEYIRPVRLFDSVLGRMWLKNLGLAKWTVQAEFTANGVVRATARQTGVFVSTSTMKAVRIPQALRAKFERAAT
jgi:acyl-CoA thioester hydrolase